MAKDHRRLDAELAQEVLMDDPGFPKQIVERAVQQMLEAEMTEHVGVAPHERTDARKGHRNGYKPRALRTRVGTSEPTRTPGPGGHLLHSSLLPLPAKREGACFGLDGDVRGGVSTRRVKEIRDWAPGTGKASGATGYRR